MRFSFLGRAMLAVGVLCIGTSISEAGFRHHHRLRQGGCSDPCQTASAWGGVSYNSAYSAGYGAHSGYAAGGYGVGGYGGGYGAPGYAGQAYAAPAVAYRAPYAPAYGGQCGPAINAGAYSAPYATGAQGYSRVYSAPAYSAQAYSAPTYSAPAVGMAAMSGAGMSSSVAYGINQMAATVDLGPMTMYKVVLEPQVTTESRIVNSMEYREEARTRARVVQRTQPVQFEDYRTRTVMVPKTETKSIEYSVLVPHTSEKTVEVVESVPVWKEVQQNYTVKVPVLTDVQEEYEVRVAQLQDQEFTYTAYVPHAETQTRMQTVTNAVPVTKSRTVTVNVPVSRTQTVTKDYGHWETRMEEVTVQSSATYSVPVSGGYAPAAPAVQGCGAPSVGYGMGGCSPCASASAGRHHGLIGKLLHHHHRGGHAGCGRCGGGGCSSCGGGAAVYAGGASCGVTYGGAVDAGYGMSTAQVIQSVPSTQMVARQVWVPNVVTEDVSVVENVPQSQEITYTVYEQRSEQVPYEATSVSYRPEVRTGTRKVVNYVPEKRTRTRKVVNYQDETRTRTLRQASYEQKTRTDTIPVISYTTEKRTKEVTYTVNVPETQVEPFTATRYETVEEVVNEQYTERVAVPVSKEVQVQVTRMVPKLVAYQVNLSAPATGSSVPVNGGCVPGYGGQMPGYGVAPGYGVGPGYGVAPGCGCGGANMGAGTAIGGCSNCGVSVGCPSCR